ncbi:hypothetical protein ACU4GD_43360 [Cupriavidus basilensis]
MTTLPTVLVTGASSGIGATYAESASPAAATTLCWLHATRRASTLATRAAA